MVRPRMTLSTQLVLQALLSAPVDEQYGLEISEAAGLATGTVHPILARLEALGWLASRWEDLDPHRAGRPARRYYRLTGSGVEEARAALANAYPPSRLQVLRVKPLGPGR